MIEEWGYDPIPPTEGVVQLVQKILDGPYHLHKPDLIDIKQCLGLSM